MSNEENLSLIKKELEPYWDGLSVDLMENKEQLNKLKKALEPYGLSVDLVDSTKVEIRPDHGPAFTVEGISSGGYSVLVFDFPGTPKGIVFTDQ